ncbi:MAG TPA: sensor histidine kinase, partial [Gemmatimonadaceae bacterium]|nr:sensor histidine kinase [Gemmatimonadaceae bacterium]
SSRRTQGAVRRMIAVVAASVRVLAAALQGAAVVPGEIRESGLPELHAGILQLVVTLALAWVCATLYRVYRKPFYAWWAVAWMLYVMRLGAILNYLLTHKLIALYWHQVLTGWAGLALLAAATVFARGGLRWWFALAAAFPPIWSYIAIYRLEPFIWAALPAVLFLSAATLATGAVFGVYAVRVRSIGANILAAAFVLWAVHHLDYPVLRQRGEWVPWGYYLDIVFELAAGTGILLLVADDLRRGLDAMTTLSSELQGGGTRERSALLDALLARPLSLPAVRGAAVYSANRGVYEAGSGVCAAWRDRAPKAGERERLELTASSGTATTQSAWGEPDSAATHPFAALLPIPSGEATNSALVIIGEARTPFTVLDERFLTALGQQFGGALANAALTDRLRQRSVDLERLSARMVAQHEEERRRLSRELHDETAQVLSALKLELGVLKRAVGPGDQHRVDDALALADAGIRSIRAVTNELRPALLDDLGLGPALRSLVNEFRGRTGLGVQLALPDRPLPALSPDAELALFRALQEGLANIVRHAEAASVEVTLSARDGVVTLSIADDGVGIRPGAGSPGAMGLTGMRERVAALGGSVVVEPRTTGGTEIRITLRSRNT